MAVFMVLGLFGLQPINIQAAVSLQTFDEWALQLPEGSRGSTDDADGDGNLNIVEYSLGMSGLVPGNDGLPVITRENGVITYSLANVLNMHRPLVIMDEAHNARTELSFDTLIRFDNVSAT